MRTKQVTVKTEEGKGSENRFERVAKGFSRVFCGIRKASNAISPFVWIFPPVIVFLAMLLFFKADGLYPFGTKTLSWCDMDQQVVPLLIDLKDILSGKEGFFFSFKNAGGMNFYGVFFFFLSSPFSMLVAFVDKAEVALFANVLVALKMSAISCTASVYFSKKHPEAGLLNVALSVLYAFSGYVMMYFQNVMWLDIVYLFPLLLLGLEKLKEGKRALFTAVLAACLFVNYYLSYMIVVFLLLYVFVALLVYKDKKFAGNFALCCVVAALVSAVVWLPCFLQYFSSGRKTSIYENLVNSSAFTAYQTSFPTVFSVLFLFPFAFSGKDAGKDSFVRRILFIATLVPIVLEPVNKMWQTGSYMSFPTRYAFITIFLCLTLAMDCMTKKDGKKLLVEGGEASRFDKASILEKLKKEAPRYAVSLLLLGVSIWYCSFAIEYTKVNHEIMDQYSTTLWGNAASFDALLALYAVAVAVGVLAYVLYRFRLLKPVCLWLAVGIMVVSELYVAPMTYIHAPAHDVAWQQQVLELADKLEDDGFYRVKSDKEYSGRDFDVNLMGSLGYNALGHYTSLTKSNYMTAIKQFGYTSYWMEVGNSGGTFLTDALLSVKYSISSQRTSADVYQGEYFNISSLNAYLPLGIVTKRDIVKAAESGADYTRRAELQSILAEDFFGSAEGVTTYTLADATLSNLTMEECDGKYVLTPSGGTGRIVFRVPVAETATLYFNAFDENTNALKQAINSKFSVSAPSFSLSDYPTQKQNGLVRLGEYSDREVTVTVTVKSAVTVRDVGLVALENERLTSAIGQTETVGLTAEKDSLSGSYTAKGGECVFLSVAYDSGMKLKINGKKAELYEVYDGFTAFYLEEGVNDISITFAPKGFVVGVIACLLGVGGCVAAIVLWFRKKWRFELPPVLESVAYYALLAVGAAVVLVVYALPLLLAAL